MTDEMITQMPEIVQEQFMQEHAYADDPRNAHPIDEDILYRVCDSKMGPVLIDYDLALLQSIAVREVLPYNNDHETWVEQQDDTHYYQITSRVFYELLALAHQRYDRVHVEIENAPELAEAHTRQYLRDMHGYEGDFGGETAVDGKYFEPTLCHAQNDDHSLRDEEPEDAHYAFTDARGLVIEEGTHEK